MKKSYVPSPYTLSVLENYGCKTFQRCLTKTKTSDYLTTQPKKIARKNNHAFDKQNLLEQLRSQKSKIHMMSTMNLHLHHTLEKTRIKRSIPKQQPRAQSKTGHITISLKRQVDLLVQELEKQRTNIKIIKTSKKYNRFEELKKLKEVYLEQISSVKDKIRQFGHAIRERKRMITSQRKRQRGVRYMNRAIQHQVITQNKSLMQQIQNLRAKTEMDLLKKASLKREKERILKDIFEMQQKTGKQYILKEQPTEESPWQFNGEQISRLQQKYPSQKQTKQFQQKQDYSESYEQEGQQQLETEGDDQQQKQGQVQQSSVVSFPKDKKQSISF